MKKQKFLLKKNYLNFCFKNQMFSDTKFKDLEFLREDIKFFLAKNKYKYLTNIQKKTFTDLENNKNNIILAETGSGKTLAYLLPIINDIYNHHQNLQNEQKNSKKEKNEEKINFSGNKEKKNKNNDKNTKDSKIDEKYQVVILTSSKELTSQILTDIRKIDRLNKIEVRRLGNISDNTSFYENGKNANYLSDERDFNESSNHLSNYINFKKTDILITTPSQFQTTDQFNMVKNFNPRVIVIDEADSLFKNEKKSMKYLFSKIYNLKKNKKDQFLDENIKYFITAASINKKIMDFQYKKFFNKILKNYRLIKNDNFLKINKNVTHNIIETNNLSFEEKLYTLQNIIENSDYNNFIIYINSNEKIKQILFYFKTIGFPICEISQNLKENENTFNMYKFKNNELPILICSDSMNRGIHFDFPCHVIQFDSAKNLNDLVHRFGRTGRLGGKGLVTSFCGKNDFNLLLQFQEFLDQGESLEGFSKSKVYVKG